MKKFKTAIKLATGAMIATAGIAPITAPVLAENDLDFELAESEIEAETVYLGTPASEVDLTDNLKKGLLGSTMETMEVPDTTTTGNKVGKLKISKDGKSKVFSIPVNVVEHPSVNPLTVVEKGAPNYEEGLTDKAVGDVFTVDDSKVDLTKPGKYFAKLTRNRSGTKTVFYIPITVTKAPEEAKTEADNFDPTGKVLEEKVIVGGKVDLKDNISGLPAGARVEEVTVPSTASVGDFKGKVKIIFADNSFKEVEVPVKVEANPYKVDYSKVKDEEVKVGDKIDLTDNISGLPAGTRVAEVDKPSTDKAGTFYGKVRVTFPNSTTEDVTIKVTVKEDYKNYKIASKDIKDEEIQLGDEVDLTDNIKNLPKGSKVKEKDVPRIEKTGNFYGKVEVTFPDGEKQTVEVKIIVTSKYEDYKIKSSDIQDEEVFVGDSIDLTDNIKNLPSKSKIKEESVPQTTAPGTFYGKVKVTFADGTTKNVEIKVIVKEKEQPWSITTSDIITEKVNVGGAIDITDNIKNLPDGAKVRPVSLPITDAPGTNVAKAEIVLKDGKVIPVDIPVEITGEALENTTPSVGITQEVPQEQTPESPAPKKEAEYQEVQETTKVNELGKEPYKGEIVKTSDASLVATKANSIVSLLGAGGIAGVTGVGRILKRKKK